MIFFLLALAFACAVAGQDVRKLIYNGKAIAKTYVAVILESGEAPPAGPTYTDNFDSYNDASTLAGQGYWVQEYGTMTISKPASDGRVYANSSSAMSGVYYNAAISGNHYSQVSYDAVSSPYVIGPGVRLQGDGSGYVTYSGSTTSYIYRYDTGTPTASPLETGSPYSASDVIKLACNGDTIFVYKNGALDTSFDGVGYVIDDTYTGGYAGLIGYDAGSSSLVDDWEAGAFTGSGLSPAAPSEEHPMTHNQVFLAHQSVQSGDYIGYFHYLCTDSIFNARSGSSYSWSIISGNTDVDTDTNDPFSIGSSTGLITVNDPDDITTHADDWVLGIEVSYGSAKDTAYANIYYNGSAEFFDLDAGTNGSGTRASPYNTTTAHDALGDIDAGDMILFKRGTDATPSQIQIGTTGGQWTYIGAYGTGAKPRFGRTTTSSYFRTFQFGSFTAEDATEGSNMDADSIYICDLEFYGRDDSYLTHNGFRVEEWADEIHFYRCDFDDLRDDDGAHAWAYFIISSDAYSHDFNSSMNDCYFEDWYSADYAGRAIKLEGGGIKLSNITIMDHRSSGAAIDIGHGDFNYPDPIEYIYVDGTDNAYASAIVFRQQGTTCEWAYVKDMGYAFDCEDADFYPSGGAIPYCYNITVRNFMVESGGQINRFEVIDAGNSDDQFSSIVFENGFAQNMSTGFELEVDSNPGEITGITIQNCLVLDGDYALYVDASEVDTIQVYNNIFHDASTNDVYTSASLSDGYYRNNIHDGINSTSNWAAAYSNNYDYGTSGDPFNDESGGDYSTDATATSVIDGGYSITGRTYSILLSAIGTHDIGPFEYGETNTNWTIR